MKTARNVISFTRYNRTVEKKLSPSGHRYVDVRNDPVDNLCVCLVATGRANGYVRLRCAQLCEKLKRKVEWLSDGQIRYRCLQADVYRQDYRDGIDRPYTRMLFGIESQASFQDAVNRHIEHTLRRK